MPRIALLSGSRVGVVNAPEDATVLRPPPPGEPIADVGAAVRDALRFPLSGEPLEALATRGGRATIVVEPPLFPFPGGTPDPRQAALAATVDELERVGVPSARQTILVAGGLWRRLGTRELEALLGPPLARRFRGRVEAHDAEDDGLVRLGRFRVNPALAAADLVLTLTAAESAVHGGPAALVRACGAETARAAAGGDSLLETGRSAGWALALEVERAVAARTAVVGASLVLGGPRLTGAFAGYPFEPGSLEHLARSPLRRVFSTLPSPLRRGLLDGLARELSATAAFAGPPSVAHAEALVRAIAARAVELERPVDALLVPVPWRALLDPRERPNPLSTAFFALGFVLRLWRDAFPVVDGGTVILLHHFTREFSPAAHGYRLLLETLRAGRDAESVAAAERADAADERALAGYRAGRRAHPLLPYAEWEACAPALARLGSVIVAGCRDAQAARALGFVPTHSAATALGMAYGRAGADARIGIVAGPPWFPLDVGPG